MLVMIRDCVGFVRLPSILRRFRNCWLGYGRVLDRDWFALLFWYCAETVVACGSGCFADLCCANFRPFSVCFAGIYREGLGLWPSVCCRKSAFWIEMGKLVPELMLWMRLRRLDRMGGARNNGFSLNLDHFWTKINKKDKD